MDASEFTELGRQHLLPIPEGWAFLPPRVPPEIIGTSALLRAADACRGAVSELTGSTRVSVGFDELAVLLFKPIALNEAVSTTRIEGIHTQVVDLVINDAVPGGQRVSQRSPEQQARILEAENAAATVQLGYEWLSEGRQLGLPFFKDLHGRILQSARGKERNAGGFRERQVWLGEKGTPFSSATYVPPPPEHIVPLLENLVHFMTAEPGFGAIIDSAIGHYQFEAIHPFEDGNGRLGRALVPLHLIHHRVLDRPWLAISSALDSRRDEYLTRLKRVSTHQEWSEWILFFLDATTQQANDSLRRVRRAIELRESYRERLSGLPTQVPARALDFTLRNVFVSVADIGGHTGTSYPTARNAIDEMVRSGILESWGKLGAKQYWHAAEFLADVYESGFSGTPAE